MATKTDKDGGWVQIKPYDDDEEELGQWNRDTKAALERMSSARLVEWKVSGEGFAVRLLPPSSSPTSQPPSNRSQSHREEHSKDFDPDDEELARLEQYYATRGWTIMSGPPAYAAGDIVSRLNEASGEDGEGQVLQSRRLDDDVDDDGDDTVLAVRRDVDGDTEVVTFDPLDVRTLRQTLRRLASRLPLNWHESRTDSEGGRDKGDRGGVRFTAALDWPTDPKQREEIEHQPSQEGYVTIVGADEPDDGRTVLRGMKLLMRGSGGLELEYALCDDVLGVMPPWVRERRNRDYREAGADTEG